MAASMLARFAASPSCVPKDCAPRPCTPRASCASVAVPAKSSRARRLSTRAVDGEQQSASAAVAEEPRASTSGAAEWGGFGARVSGEWDGYSAEFNFAGEPFELPSNVVPDAFREWGVEVHDWQTQCPTLAHPEPGHLWYKVIRLHPTVGCEADAATVYGVEKCETREQAAALTFHSSGSYTAVWRGRRVTREHLGSGPGVEVVREGDDSVEVEQCLVHEQKRIRVLQRLDPRRRVLVFREAWDGPFRNGESLGGCAIGTPAFATQKPLEPSTLTGSWRSHVFSAPNLQHRQEYTASELVPSGVEDIQRRLPDLVLYLPIDAWTSLSNSASGGTVVETGWLVTPDQVVVSVCEFGSSGNLKGVSLRLETRISRE